MQVDPANVPLPTPSTDSDMSPPDQPMPASPTVEPAPLLSTSKDKLSTRPSLEREAGRPLEQHKTYTMPWQTCSVCPCYPFPSLLLLDPSALWQPSPPVSRAILLQHHQSPQPDRAHQNQRQAPLNDPSPGTSKILRIPSTDGACNKLTRSTSSKPDTITQYHARPQLDRAHSQPHPRRPSRPRPTRAQALARRQPAYVRLA